MVQRDEKDKSTSIFIKRTEQKKGEIAKPKETFVVKVKFANKKWEPKKGGNPKDLELSNNVTKKLAEKIPKVITKLDKNHQNILNILDKHDKKRI